MSKCPLNSSLFSCTGSNSPASSPHSWKWMLSWILLNLVIGKEHPSATEPTTIHTDIGTTRHPQMWASATWQPYTPWLHWSLVIASTQVPFKQTLTQQSSRWLWGCLTTTRIAGSEAGVGTAWGPSSLVMPGVLLAAKDSRLCPVRSHGALFPNGGLSHPCWQVKQPSLPPPPMVLSPMSHLPYVFFILYPGSLGKVLGSGFARGKPNTVWIRKIPLNFWQHQI